MVRNPLTALGETCLVILRADVARVASENTFMAEVVQFVGRLDDDMYDDDAVTGPCVRTNVYVRKPIK